MSAARRSISQRMQRAGSIEVRREIAQDWAANWMRDHDATLVLIERALQHGQVADAGRHLGQLKALSDKAMTALPNVINALTGDDVL